MNNPTQNPIRLDIGGLGYLLVFEFEAIAEAEELTGRALLTGLKRQDIEAPSISLVRLMLFACLHARQPNMTLDQVKPLVTRNTLPEIWNKVLEAWTAGMAEPDEDADELPQAISQS
jgi:hypothetical protein